MKNKSNDHLNIFGKIGEGCFGTIFLAKKFGGQDDGLHYAVKKVQPFEQTKDEYENSCLREFKVFKLVKNIEFFIQLKYACRLNAHIFFVMDFQPNGNLLNYLSNVSRLTPDEALICIAEMAMALKYLHSNRIVYRDLKLENILIDQQNHILLCDFGLTTELKQNEKLFDTSGTLSYMAPEIIKNYIGYGFEVDWWSLGIISHELLVGHSPFLTSFHEHLSDKDYSKRIIRDHPKLDKLLHITQSEKTKDFIEKLLDKDATQRLGAGIDGYLEIERHPYFEQINWLALKLKAYKCLRNVPNKSAIEKNLNFKITIETNRRPFHKDFFHAVPELNGSECNEPCTGLQLLKSNRSIYLENKMQPFDLLISNKLIRTSTPLKILHQFSNEIKGKMIRDKPKIDARFNPTVNLKRITLPVRKTSPVRKILPLRRTLRKTRSIQRSLI